MKSNCATDSMPVTVTAAGVGGRRPEYEATVR